MVLFLATDVSHIAIIIQQTYRQQAIVAEGKSKINHMFSRNPAVIMIIISDLFS